MTNTPKSADTSSTTFGLLRHGETEWNTEKKIQGYGDSPLTDNGILQTEEWGQTLTQWKWHRIVASDLGRVRQTVAILNHSLQLPVAYNASLREQSWGEWEGLTINTIKQIHKAELERRVALGWEFSPPGGESRNEVRKRVFSSLLDLHHRFRDQKILVICHHGVIKTILYHITGREFLPGEDPLLHHNNFHLIRCEKGCFSTAQLNIPRTFRK